MYKVIDNFLDAEDFDYIKNFILSDSFNWYYQDKVVTEKEKIEKKESLYYCHLFFLDQQRSDVYPIVKPILDKLNIVSLKRVKANLYPKTEKIYVHGYHKDFIFPNKGAIFYINKNNGYTILDKDVKIENKENRILLFNANELHTSTTCTDEFARVNININYMSYDS